jgi:heme/copper-type cytochrome/quinol oxidase subunit 4
MAGKQIRFPEKQTHDKRFEYAMVAFSVACIVFTIIAINVVAGGDFG